MIRSLCPERKSSREGKRNVVAGFSPRLHLCQVNRQLIDAFARRGGNGIGERSGSHSRAGFTNSTGDFGTLYDMNVDLRRFVVPDHLVIIEMIDRKSTRLTSSHLPL